MVTKAAPWAHPLTKFLSDTPVSVLSLYCVLLCLPLLVVGDLFPLLAIPMALTLAALKQDAASRPGVWCWASEDHARVPYWFANELRGTAYGDLAVSCVDYCSFYSLDSDPLARDQWVQRLYSLYHLYMDPFGEFKFRNEQEILELIEMIERPD